jgi:hypothetical protein
LQKLPRAPELPKIAKIENQKPVCGETPWCSNREGRCTGILRHALNSLRRFERLRMTGPGGFAFIGIDENDELAETTDVENEEARLNTLFPFAPCPAFL